ncbi:VOC family protein [Planktotalea sp.]|uniref:bleomycin resistance protein n=1 Tax=Planktotalea sp. TaxID=2029877 RepID=UPI0032998152
MPNDLVPEFAVSDWMRSRRFYCEILGFEYVYERAEDGFSYLKLGGAELMIDQIGTGRTFDDGHLPDAYPFGRGLNVQIKVDAVAPMIKALRAAGIDLYLALEDRWYRKGDIELGNRQFVVADPDGYLLRFYQDIGSRTV